MDNLNQEAIEAAGFKIDQGGNIRMSNGHRVKKEVAEQVAAGTIIANFDPDSIRKARARKAATGTADLVKALNDISPAIAMLAVGQTAKLTMPKDERQDGKSPKRAFVMGIVTKLNNVTAAGREWAGRKFEALSDPDGEYFYVTRMSDTAEPHKRKSGGGRKPKASNLEQALAASKEHLAGNNPSNDDAAVIPTAEAAAEGETVTIGGTEGGEVIEEAQVIPA